MQIALKCAKCGNIFKDTEDDMCLEIDFKERKMTYICRNSKCHHENVLDFKNWQEKSKHSPLPVPSVFK